MNRILIYHHYKLGNNLSEYVLYTLKELRYLFTTIVFVSNSELNNQYKHTLNDYCDKIIIRQNKGFDFGGWKDAIAAEGWNSLEKYDSLTLMNDLCFGPLFDMNKIYSKMESASNDFWGLTNHKKTFSGMRGKKGVVPEHIQSNFLCFNRIVLKSPVFKTFWKKVKYYSDVNKVIQNYETQLAGMLKRAGFSGSVFIDTREYKLKSGNLATWHPDVLIRNGIPFVKIKSFLYFDHPLYLKKLINRVSVYDTGLIDDHLYQIFNPNESIRMINRSLNSCSPKDEAIKPALKTAIHLHVYYTDVFRKYIEALGGVKTPFELYLSTDTEEKKEEILALSEEKQLKNYIKKIIICKNSGRDIAPWLVDFKEINENYDIVGHFHTKKNAWSNDWVGESWQDEIIESMIANTDYILNYFQEHKKVGVIIPDIPYCYSYVLKADTWGGNRGLFNRLWKRMNLTRKLDARLLDYPIMPYGNMFWYRPAALKPLFDLNLSREDFPEEPIPVDGTIAHAIERMPVYIAWSQGYDYRVSFSQTTVKTAMEAKGCRGSLSAGTGFKLHLKKFLNRYPGIKSIIVKAAKLLRG